VIAMRRVRLGVVRPFAGALLFAALVTTGAPAKAFQPAERIEHEDARGFDWIVRPSTSDGSKVGDAPREFVGAHGGRWRQRSFGPGGQFRHLWGSGVEVDEAAVLDPAVAARVAGDFWYEHAYLLPPDVSADDLELLANARVGDTRYVSHRQTVHGRAVEGASVFLAIKYGRVVWLGVRCFGDVQAPSSPRIGPQRASGIARQHVAPRDAAARIEDATLVVVANHDGVASGLAYRVEVVASTGGRWTVYVDARDEDVVAVRDERRFLQASIELEHHDRHVGNPALIASTAPYLWTWTDDGHGYTDDQGRLSDSHESTTAFLRCAGQYTRLFSVVSSDVVATTPTLVDGDVYLWQADDPEYDQAQLDVYRFAVDAHDFTADLVDDVEWLDGPVAAYVNVAATCNAHYDGAINFYRSGDGCNNTGMIADVVYHEFGHGFHIHSMIPGVGAYYWDTGEAYADTLSFLMTGDSVIAPHFFTGGGAVRDVEPDRVYPSDLVGECHTDGLILGGAIWDLRKRLIDDLGEEAGAALVADLFGQMVKTSTDMVSAWEAAIVADDDNGDLSDGTPHYCAITESFALHGLAEAEVEALAVDFTPLQHGAQPGDDLPIEVLVSGGVDCSGEERLGEMRLLYSLDGGVSWVTQPLSEGDTGRYAGSLPTGASGTTVLYRIEADRLADGSVLTLPDNEAEPYYELYVGELFEIECDTLAYSGEWSHGADSWQWGGPEAGSGDPGAAYSGHFVWGNDLGGGGVGGDGAYTPNETAVLHSPEFDLATHSHVRLRFQRWLRVEDGYFDQARVEVNGEVVWSNAVGGGELHHLDRQWIPVDLDISEWAGCCEDVQLSWVLESDGGLEFGGWTIDDVCLYSTTDGTSAPWAPAGDGTPGDADPETPWSPCDVPLQELYPPFVPESANAGCTCPQLASTAPGLPTAALLLLMGTSLVQRRRR